MSSEIPVYPRQPVVDVGTVEPGPAPSGFPGGGYGEVLIHDISQAELESETPTLASIQGKIAQEFEQGIIPEYQFYYWFYEFDLDTEVVTGLQTNHIWATGFSDFETCGLIINKSSSTIQVRMYFIYHPINYETSEYNSQWYIGLAKDNSNSEMKILLKRTDPTAGYYYSDPENDLYCCNIALIPWTGITSERMYPQNGIKIFGSNRLPLTNE